MFRTLSAKRRRAVSKAVLDLSDFTDEEQRAFLLLAEGVRRRHKGEPPREGFSELWERLSSNRTPIDDEEVDSIVSEAVAFARGRV
jgi:hypothetical protein